MRARKISWLGIGLFLAGLGARTPAPAAPSLPTLPAATATSTPTPWALPSGFDPAVYPTPTPHALTVQLTYSAACPNPAGLEESPPPKPEEILSLLQALASGDPDLRRRVTDPALWPLLPPAGQPALRSSVLSEDLKAPRPGIEGPYGELLQNGYGEAVMKRLWWVEVCPGPCAQTDRLESLKNHLWLIRREGRWLIWALR
jgi:hypothetical protein